MRIDTNNHIYHITPLQSTNYHIRSVQNRCGQGIVSNKVDITVIPILGEPIIPLPATPVLFQNMPNPATGQTRIRFGLPTKERVLLRLLSTDGRTVQKLTEGVYAAGWHSLEVNTSALPAGIYFFELRTSATTLTRRMVVIR